MDKSRRIRFRTGAFFLCLGTLGLFAQKETKTYTETFVVTDDTVLELDTSHADIQFETWSKNQVSIETTVSLEGATEDEVRAYFKNDPVTIMGNSKRITLRTNAQNAGHTVFGPEGFVFNMPEIPSVEIDVPVIPDIDVESFVVEIPEIVEFPPLPSAPFPNFDYETYEKEGEVYLKKWQKEFGESFDENYKEKMRRWRKRAEERRKEWQERNAIRIQKREQARAERIEKMAVAKEAGRDIKEHARAAREVAQEARRAALKAHRHNVFVHQKGSFATDSVPNAPNIFYFNNNGEHKNYKVKKTIRIKMPKNMRIQMNVRHGEVKLAELAKNVNATLAHAHLWAGTIEGDLTNIRAQYSPVHVKRWNYGQLQTEYSENVDLQEVLSLKLSATSSDISIDRILQSAFIKNDLGPLYINTVSKNFKELDVSLQNAEFTCNLPETAFNVYVNGTNSQIHSSDQLVLERTKNLNTEVIKGYHLSDNALRSIVIHSQFSKVVLD